MKPWDGSQPHAFQPLAETIVVKESDFSYCARNHSYRNDESLSLDLKFLTPRMFTASPQIYIFSSSVYFSHSITSNVTFSSVENVYLSAFLHVDYQ